MSPDERSGRAAWGRTDAAEDGGRSRAQTTQDFAFGISIFVLAAVFVVTFVPDVTTPFATGITEVEQERSQTASRLLVGNVSDDGTPELNTSRTDAFFDRSWADGELERALGLPRTASVNVTMRTADPPGDIVMDHAIGDAYRQQAGATSVRIVSYDDTVYRLEVRVW
ncbi:hypothetical protein N0B31_20675 [Salinirubellus salinus]|uniref:Uncharacterized protein n=1 Tax=Salinirubellus salinus TaxID=1364945 RepID=A0A9E7R305_9EURY|nr:hypothetical protein [Salinirubellus salinus]UWM54523.1 hypothetical protein N0B31_20675 [Salinirubellus salinus]